ncbi:uncharacterized protein LOC141903739 [Tubulanus polymorphus]|uniref:uncharacterized protein LOC141903739 n=1 Tax=Tubulanus polymorphus TaxID=672921 RepID=UPI003DA65031
MVLAESNEVQQQSGGALQPQEQSSRRHRRRTPTAAAQPLLSSQVTTTRQQSTQSARGGNVTLRPGFAHDRTLVLGVIQLLSGVAAIILATVAIASMAWGYFVGAGIWTGAFFISSGIVGIICSKRKDNCTIIAFLVLSIISSVVALMLVGFSAAGIVIDFLEQTHLKNSQVMVVHSLILVIAFIQGICAIVSSTICCKTVCCQGILNPPPYGYPYCPTEGQQIAIFQPHPGRTGGIFSLPHGAYIIQPAESGNNQILYMLPAPETIRHNLPPPPYYSRERLDDDEPAVSSPPIIVTTTTTETNVPASPAPPYNSMPNVNEMNGINSHNTSQGSIQVIPVVDPNLTLEIAPPSTVTENLQTYESPRITMGQENEENKP